MVDKGQGCIRKSRALRKKRRGTSIFWGALMRHSAPPCIHPHESLTASQIIFHRGGFNLHLSSRPSCLLVCQLLTPSFPCGKDCRLQPSNQSCGHRCDIPIHRAGSYFVLIANPLQKWHYHAHHINLQIIWLFSIFSFPPMYLSTCLTSVCTKLTAKTFSFQCSELGSSGERLEINNKTTI